MGEHCFGFIVHRSSKGGKNLNNVIDDSFELLSWVELCVSKHRGGIVAEDIRRKIMSGCWIDRKGPRQWTLFPREYIW